MPWQAEMLLISQEMSVYGTRWRAGTTLVRPGVRGKIFEVAGGQFSVAASFHFSSGGRSAIRSCRSSWATLGLLSGPTRLGWVNQRSGNTPLP